MLQRALEHLFECSARSTDLQPLDLWTRPAETAEFLRTLTFFDLPEEERLSPESFPPSLRATTEKILHLIKKERGPLGQKHVAAEGVGAEGHWGRSTVLQGSLEQRNNKF